MYLLTGSAGYIGSALLDALNGSPDLGGSSVVCVDRVAHRVPAGVRLIEADLLDQEAYGPTLETVDCVLHLAAAKGDWGISRDDYFRDNLAATRALISVGRRSAVRRWIFFSTVSVLGPSGVPLSEDADPNPINAYGESKLACEKLFHDLAISDPECVILIIRPSVVFGPENPRNTNIFRLIDAIYRRRFVMIGDGAVQKTTSYIDNLVAATRFLLNRDRFDPGVHVYHYVDEPVMSTELLVSEIVRLLGMKRSSLRLPLGLARPFAKIGDIAADWTGVDLPITSARVEKFCTSTNFSSAKIRRLGFQQPVANRDALASTVSWYLNNVATLPN